MRFWRRTDQRLAAHFSWTRLTAIALKELVQMKRDRLTFGMIVGIPILQLILFGFAINPDPKHLATTVLMQDASTVTRALLAGMKNSGYFEITQISVSEEETRQALQRGEAQFALTIPVNFTHRLLRGERPQLLLEVDATDPAASSNAIAALRQVAQGSLAFLWQGSLSAFASAPPPFEVSVHALYNPDAVAQFNIVPGLLGVVLTMTMVMITALAITRERERGTMENLLAMPTRPLEVLIGKLAPYVAVGYLQIGLLLICARLIFHVPMAGSLLLLFALALFFISANLAVGITLSTVATNQLQAVQMSVFFFLPSILMSGFMFPFRGMPGWAQAIGEVLPLTHFLRIVRGILLKGASFAEIGMELLPLTAFLVVVMTLGVLRYRQTLD